MIFHICGRRHGDDEASVHTIPDCKTKGEAWLAFCREVLPDTLTEQEIREVSVGDNKNYVIHQVSIIADPSDELLAALIGLVKEIPLRGLNIRKDFSLINAHAAATKAIAKATEETLNG